LSGGASFRIRPSVDYVAGGQWVLAVWSNPVALAGSAVTVQLDPLPSVPYELELTIPEQGGRRTLREYRIVPSSGSPVKWEDCTQVVGPGSTPSVPTALEARVTALEAALGSVSGGASTTGGITDMPAPMKTFNQSASYSAARTTLGVAAATHAHAIGDITATGTPSNTTFLRGDGTWSGTPAAGNPDWADITGKPSTFTPATHTHDAADIVDATAVGVDVLTAADAAAARTAIGAMGTADVIDDSNMVVAGVMFADGASTPRPTARTDIRVLWTASSAPSNAIAGDVWLNGPD
jgi:hypothetical protein